MKVDFSIVNFHTQLNSEDYINNQRLYVKLRYIDNRQKNYGESESYEDDINRYFEYLDKYPEYAEKCEQHQKTIVQKIGYKKPLAEAKNPDHDYASRMTGISSDFVLSEFRGYYYRSDASIKPKDDWEEEQESWLNMMR